MKKVLPYVLTVILTLLIAGSLFIRFARPGIPAGRAYTQWVGPVTVTAAAKTALKTDIDARMAGQTAEDEQARLERADELLLEFGSTANELLLTDLMADGLFLLEQPQVSKVKTDHAARKGVDLSVLSPCVFYDGYTGEWIVLCGGWWNSDQWDGLLSGNAGGRNAWGVEYSHTAGAYDTHVTAAAAGLWSSGNHAEYNKTTGSRSGGDGAVGFDFELQDRIVTTGIFNHLYIGEKWAGFVRYAPGFEKYEATMTAYYTCD